MERFNANLYDKYSDLKVFCSTTPVPILCCLDSLRSSGPRPSLLLTIAAQGFQKRKVLVEEEWNHRSQSCIRDYQSDVEGLIEELKSENDRLRAQVASVQGQYGECEKHLLEECRKTKQLAKEVERLQKLLSHNNEKSDSAMMKSPRASPRLRSRSKTKGSHRKTPTCFRQNEVEYIEAASAPYDNCLKELVVASKEDLNYDNFGQAIVRTTQPDCCRRNMNSGEATSEGQSTCVFKTLMEFLVGMKFCVGSQTEEPCLSVIHQMSGYTFTLTWLSDEEGREGGELMYHVSSLGTLERVALEWMKEDMIFSLSMCPVFFQRISRVIGR